MIRRENTRKRGTCLTYDTEAIRRGDERRNRAGCLPGYLPFPEDAPWRQVSKSVYIIDDSSAPAIAVSGQLAMT